MRFGDTLVYFDLDDIKAATEWMTEIRAAIASSEVFLPVVGPKWLDIGKRAGRWKDPRDVLRLEMEIALERKMPLVPILVGDAAVPEKEDLPGAIAKLFDWQALRLRDQNWGSDVERLVWRISEVIEPVANGPVSLLQAHRELDDAQRSYFKLLDERKPAEALENVYRSLAFLNRVSPRYPQDPYLQLVRGYLHKNEAMALIRLKRRKEAGEALAKADRVFAAIRQEGEWRMAGAFNGAGSVSAVSGRYEQALAYIDRALELAPEYGAALEDRKTVLGRMLR
jgi:tetratricopeptide (TPR) repeat protein